MIWQLIAAGLACTTAAFAILWARAVRERSHRLARKVNRLGRRISKMSTESLPGWAEQALGETGRSFSAWRRSGEPILLDETYLGSEALVAVFGELRKRFQ